MDADSTALPWFSGLLCLTPVLLFGAAEHRGLCEDEFPTQHLEACLMIIKNKMNYSLKWQGGGVHCGLGLTLLSHAYPGIVKFSIVSEETPPETFKILFGLVLNL